MVNSLSSNIPNTNITASPKINEEKTVKEENGSKPQAHTLNKIKSFTTSQKSIGIATMGLGALAAASTLTKNKNGKLSFFRTAAVLPAAIIVSMLGTQMYSSAIKADEAIKKSQENVSLSSTEGPKLDTEG